MIIATTTTPFLCGSSCVNQTWTSSANLLAEWLFDESYRDQMNNYNATPTNTMSFTTNGYVNQAIIFSSNANAMLTVPYIPLSYTSFTIDMWLYITALLNIQHHGIFGYCFQPTAYNCLHLTIRQSGSNYNLYLGFYYADCEGVTSLPLNTWMHAAFVFDLTTFTQEIYLNGVLENSCIRSSAVTATPSNITIGYIPTLTSAGTYYQGYMDQMTVSNRAKSACEILEIATLVAHFTFDNGFFLIDSGPNSLQATTQSTSSVSSGRFSQAITFTGSTSSYFQMSDFTALGISNKSFSISLWIRPVSLLGIVLYVSSNVTGTGWCMPFLGFTINGSFIAQIWNGTAHVPVVDPTFSILTSVWSNVVQTWSSTNGLRLYINNILVASRLSSVGLYSASSMPNFLSLGSALYGTGMFGLDLMSTIAYNGDMDDFRVYSRELSASDVCTLYTS